jgi:hypothetical protein
VSARYLLTRKGTRPSRCAHQVLWLALMLALVPAVAHAELTLDVRTDRSSMSLEDALTLQITVQSQGTGSPRVQLPQLDGFQVVSQQVQRPMQFSFSFGAQATVQSSTIYTFVLQAQRTGTLVIKPVSAELDGKVQTSRAIHITVSGGKGSPTPPANSRDPQPAGNQEPTPAGARASQSSGGNVSDGAQIDPIAFLRTVVDKPEPYEGEQVTVTIYLYLRERLQSTPNIESEPTTDGLWIHDLMPPGRTLQPARQMVGNDLYTVYVLRRVAAFPLRSGDITIGPLSLEIDTTSLFDIFSPDRARPNLKRASQPVTLHVKPLPEAGRLPGEVAVGHFALTTRIDRTQAATGNAITLTATVQGQGNIRSVRLEPPQLKGVDVLQPETKDLVESPNDLVGGTREYRFLLVPREPGRVEVPALTLATFDPGNQRYERLASAPLSFAVVGQALPSANEPKAESAPKPASEEQHSWAPIRTHSELQRGYTRLVDRPFYPLALAFPPSLWLVVIGVKGLRRRLAARTETGKGRAMRDAERRLRSAEAAAKGGDEPRFYAEASAALLGLLEARLEQGVSGLTRIELRERLATHGMEPELASEVLRALERSELMRFGSAAASSGDLDAQLDASRALFKRVAAFGPSGREKAA